MDVWKDSGKCERRRRERRRSGCDTMERSETSRYKLSLGKIFVNPFPNKPWFLRVCSRGLLKTLWEKKKLLVTSNFSFSHSVF